VIEIYIYIYKIIYKRCKRKPC